MWFVSPVCLIVNFLYVARAQSSISIDTLHVQSEIRHRYAVTLATSVISNTADFAQDVTFGVQLPKEAFISNFTMTLDGVVYPGEVTEKAAAAKKFQQAAKRGQPAGLVATKSARETNEFTVSAIVPAYGNVTFDLTYQELLQRRTGLYEHVIYVNSGVIVPDFRVEVFISESREITELTVPEVRDDRLTSSVITGTNRFAQIESISASAARVTFVPTPEQQREYSDKGISGQFIVNYDVDHDVSPEGEILTSNGYFVHFFAPEDLPTLGKRIVFVLDVSGSMVGTKIRQLREALVFILDELRPIDEFGIFLFNSFVRTWNIAEMVPATPENIRRAKSFAKTITARGATNINTALIRGLSVLSEHATKLSMVLFLTDGRATSGETNSARILENVAEARLPKQSIYSLAFGRGADFDLIRRISAQNKGFARRIYEDADASLQLAGFYNEISTPVLSDVRITYLNETVDPESVTATRYPSFFRGSEIVVTGRLSNVSEPDANGTRSLDVSIEGNQKSSKLAIRRSHIIWPCWYRRPCSPCLPGRPCPRCLPVYPCPPRPPPYPTPTPSPRPDPKPGPIQGRNDFIERLWVYLTIKQLVKKTLTEAGSSRKAAADAKAKIVELSLRYNFVTPFTSMVVTRPSREKTVSSLRVNIASASVIPRATTATALSPQLRKKLLAKLTASKIRRVSSAVNSIKKAIPASKIRRVSSAVNSIKKAIPASKIRRVSSAVNSIKKAIPASKIRRVSSAVNSIKKARRFRSRPVSSGGSGGAVPGAFLPGLYRPRAPAPVIPTTTRTTRTTTTTRSPQLGKSAKINRPLAPASVIPTTTRTTTTRPPQLRNSAHNFASGLNVEVEQTTAGRQTSRDILCLDLVSESPADAPQILLLNDTSNSILLSAVLHSSDYEGFKKFSEIQLTLNDTTTITISTKSIIVGSKTYRWWQLRTVSFQGLRITANDGIELTTSGNLTLVFHKFGLQSRRSLAKPFMTVTVKNTDQLSPSASGLLAGVVDLTNVQQTRRNTLSFTKLGPNGGTRETVTSQGKTLEGERCLRILDPRALSSILDN